MNREKYIPFGKPNYSDDEIEAVARVMRSGWTGMGPETIAFEKELSEYIGAPHVLTVNSCTSALFLSLLICGIGPGDEVICPSFTWFSTANVILYLGAKPVFCDIDRNTLCVTAGSIKEKVTQNTRAVMVVHIGGLAADVKGIRAVLPDNIAIIEDAAHAFGTKYQDGSPVGSSGNLTCFSFYANKNLSTAEGGAISILNDDIAERVRSLRMLGLSKDAWKRFINPEAALLGGPMELGYKMNYTDMQACIGRVQLRRQNEFSLIRYVIAKKYIEKLSSLLPDIRFQKDILHPNHARHLIVIELPLDQMSLSRNEILIKLREHNVGAAIHYSPLHIMSFYSDQGDVSLPITEYLCNRIITLPISASMTVDDGDFVVEQVYKLINNTKESKYDKELCINK